MMANYKHPLWQRYRGMIQRCENPKSPSYKTYGARGIGIYPRWRESFEAFCESVGMPPTPEHTLERIDNDGHYCPSNVRWATRAEQNRNKTTVRRIYVGGKPLTIPQAAEATGLAESTIRSRIYNHGGVVPDDVLCPVHQWRPASSAA